MSRWSLAAVEKAAPDQASLAAARKLAHPGPWSETGSTDTLVWGKCQGSGRTPYQVSVDLAGPAFRCSCPSRKFPCKHALALLLLWVRNDGAVADLPEAADFADAWAAERAARSAAQGTARTTAAADPEARARRAAERMATMSAGADEFALWLADLVRGGTAAARRQPWAWWDAAAARLVDAQLPGLADRVRALASEVNRRADWADHLLAELGRWWTAVSAWRRWDDLDPATQADLRAYLGWPLATDDVRAADRVEGHWQVLGAHRTDDGRLQQQRTWLRHESTGELVQVLDFAAGAQPLPVPRLVGSRLEAAVSRYPGHGPRRALFAEEAAPAGTVRELPPAAGLADALGRLAAAWAENPWAGRVPVVLEGAVSVEDDGPRVVDATGAALPLLAEVPWSLLALTGGRPAPLFGELEEDGFRPLTLVGDDGLVPL